MNKIYQEHDQKAILAFLRENSFAILVTYDGKRPIATHVPTELVEGADGALVLYTHISRANPQWHTLEGQETLLIFPGPHAYISARWYNHTNVPTWNYTMVHLYGHATCIQDEEEFRSLLSRLVAHHEADHPEYRLESLPSDFVEKELRGAIGIRLDVTRIEAGFKLSQNRGDEDYRNIVLELDQRHDESSHAVARAMRAKRAGHHE